MSTPDRPVDRVEPKPWQTGLAPVYIGTFLWVAFFDQIGRASLPLGSLGGAILGAVVAGPPAYLLLFRSSALWGRRVGQPLGVVATSTFGVRGAPLVPGLLIGVGQIVLFAIAVGYAVELTFQGLVLGGLVDPRSVRPTLVGGATLKSPLYLTTALFWAVVTALVSLQFTRWIAYLMQFFPIFPAVLLGGAMLAMMAGLRYFSGPANPTTAAVVGSTWARAFLLTFQWVFAFSAMGGVMGADWGSGSLSDRDVTTGGWVGVAFAPAIIAALVLMTVAGFAGNQAALLASLPPRGGGVATLDLGPTSLVNSGLDAPVFTFRAVANRGFDRSVGSIMLLVFGLASLAPAVYASFTFGLQFKALGAGISRLTWTMMGTCAAWLLIVGGWSERTGLLFSLLGAAFAPAAGAIAADFRRNRGVWPGPRTGLNPAGLLAWSLGLAVGLTPTIAEFLGAPQIANLQPAALVAFVVAYLSYEILAKVGLESAVTSTPPTSTFAGRPESPPAR